MSQTTKASRLPLGRLGLMAAALLIAVALLSGCTGQAVATYTDGKVSKKDFDTYLNVTHFFNPMYAQFQDDPMYQEFMLNQFLTYKIIFDKADSQLVRSMETEVKNQITQLDQMLMQELGTRNNVNAELKSYNVSRKDLEDFIRRHLVVIRHIEGQFDDAELQREYDRIRAEDDRYAFDIASVSHILIGIENAQTGEPIRTMDEALTRSQEVLAKLQAGGDFAELAKEYSDDPGLQTVGDTYEVELGEHSMYIEEFKQAAIDLPIGQISQPVRTDYGYHIMKVNSRTTLSIGDVKEDLKDMLIGGYLNNFMENELPGILVSVNLPGYGDTGNQADANE